MKQRQLGKRLVYALLFIALLASGAMAAPAFISLHTSVTLPVDI